MGEKLSDHDLFKWVGNHGHDLENPGLPQALALDLQIMIDRLETRYARLEEALKELCEYFEADYDQPPEYHKAVAALADQTEAY